MNIFNVFLELVLTWFLPSNHSEKMKKFMFWQLYTLIHVLDPKPSWKMHYNHINVWNLFRVAYSTLFSIGFAFVPRKNFKLSISIPHSTLKQKIPLELHLLVQWKPMIIRGKSLLEDDDDEEDEEEDREEEGNRSKRRKA